MTYLPIRRYAFICSLCRALARASAALLTYDHAGALCVSEISIRQGMNPPKKTIARPARFQLRIESERLERWRAAAAAAGIPLTALIVRAMDAYLEAAPDPDTAQNIDADQSDGVD